MTEDVELLPCPFCGGSASPDGVTRYSKSHEAWFEDGTQVRESFFVNCMKCGINNSALVGHQTRGKAIAAWNTRPSHASAQARIEGMRVALKDAESRLRILAEVAEDIRLEGAPMIRECADRCLAALTEEGE